jgi:hypothetical protein
LIDAVNSLTSNWGQAVPGAGAWPNWNHWPVPEYSIELRVPAPSASVADSSVPVGRAQRAAGSARAPASARNDGLALNTRRV